MDESVNFQLNIVSSGKLRKKIRPKYHSKKQRIKDKKFDKKKPYIKTTTSSKTTQNNNDQSSIKPSESVKQPSLKKNIDQILKSVTTTDSSFKRLPQPVQKDSNLSSPVKAKKHKLPDNDEADHDRDDSGTRPHKLQRTGPFISSLFNSNPEIPKIKSSAVKPLKEEMFTSKCFGDLALNSVMVTNLVERMKMKNMTTVQQLAIPTILQGRDSLVKSQTGSGKTLAYAVPIVEKLQSISPKIDRSHGPYAIVIVPTRELATQSYEVFMKVCKPFVYIVPGCLTGGEKRKAEKARIRKGINILVGTPGRVVDHLKNTHGLSVEHVKYLVLDEADRLLDMGYEKDVAQIVNCLNDHGTTKRQTILLSATLTEGVERLAGITMSDPAHVSVSSDDIESERRDSQSESKDNAQSNKDLNTDTERFAVPQALRQHFVITPCKLRLVTLAAFILSKCKFSKQKNKMIIFLSTQDSVEFHHKLLTNIFCGSGAKSKKSKSEKIEDIVNSDSDDDSESEDFQVDSLKLELFKLHGDMLQKERTDVFKKFGEIKSGVLLCTDVAARGLDLPEISWIVQYTTPGKSSDYIHRVGRTARVGSQGQSLLFLIPSEVDYIKLLSEKQISIKEMPMKNILESLMSVIDHLKFPQDSTRQRPRTWEEASTAVHMLFENHVAKHPNMTDLSRKAYQSYIRSYATYPTHMKDIFSVKNIHLGHLAKSFGLRDAPGRIGVVQSKKYKEEIALDKKENRFVKRKPRKNMSEFSSGLDSELGVRPRHKNIQKHLYKKKMNNDRKKAKRLTKQ